MVLKVANTMLAPVLARLLAARLSLVNSVRSSVSPQSHSDRAVGQVRGDAN